MSRTVAIVDVGSTSVGGAMLTPATGRDKNNRTCSTIIASSRNEIAFSEVIDLEHFLTGIESVLKQTLTDLQKQTGQSPQETHVFLSAPFYAAQTQTSYLQKPEPFAVTPSLVKEFLRAEVKSLTRDAHQLVEHKIMKFYLNGYPIDQPYIHKSPDLKIISFVSIASENVLKRLREAVRGVFHRPELFWHSFTFAFFSLLNNILDRQRCFLIVDIGGEITEVSLLGQGLLQATASFPLGRNSLVRELSHKLKTSLTEAYDSLKLLNSAAQHPAASLKLTQALAEAKQQWSSMLLPAVSAVMGGCLGFDRAYVVGDPNLLPLFRTWLGEQTLPTLTAGRQNVETETVSPELLSRFCQQVGSVSPDPSLMVETIFYDTMLKT